MKQLYIVASFIHSDEEELSEEITNFSNQEAENHYLIDSVNFSVVPDDDEFLFSALVIYKLNIQ